MNSLYNFSFGFFFFIFKLFGNYLEVVAFKPAVNVSLMERKESSDCRNDVNIGILKKERATILIKTKVLQF